MAAVTWCTGESPADLWPAVLARVPRRVVVHLASGGRDPRIAATASSLIGFLRETAPSCRIELIDRTGNRASRRPHPLIDLAAAPPLVVDAAGLRGGAPVPALWLEPFHLVTV